jgi:hypothetical protein
MHAEWYERLGVTRGGPSGGLVAGRFGPGAATLATNPTFPLWSGDGWREGCVQLTAPNTCEVLTPGTYARRSSSRVWQNKVCAWANYG